MCNPKNLTVQSNLVKSRMGPQRKVKSRKYGPKRPPVPTFCIAAYSSTSAASQQATTVTPLPATVPVATREPLRLVEIDLQQDTEDKDDESDRESDLPTLAEMVAAWRSCSRCGYITLGFVYGVAESDTDLKQALDSFLRRFDENSQAADAWKEDQDVTRLVRDQMMVGRRRLDEVQSDGSDAEEATSHGSRRRVRRRSRSRPSEGPQSIDIGLGPASAHAASVFERSIDKLIAAPIVLPDDQRMRNLDSQAERLEYDFQELKDNVREVKDNVQSILNILLDRPRCLVFRCTFSIHSHNTIIGFAYQKSTDASHRFIPTQPTSWLFGSPPEHPPTSISLGILRILF
ncbi:hypothetical protein V1520DRAFT_387898 [Lipomyces starkeyi]